MPEIAYTSLGRNVLVTGLISHGVAILVAAMSIAGGGPFLSIVYPFSCLALAVGAYAELKERGRSPLRDPRFYGITAVTVLPVFGPLFVLALLHRFQDRGHEGQGSQSGLLLAMFRIRANVLIIFVVFIVLFLLFAIIHSRHDPYFQRRAQHDLATHAFCN